MQPHGESHTSVKESRKLGLCPSRGSLRPVWGSLCRSRGLLPFCQVWGLSAQAGVSSVQSGCSSAQAGASSVQSGPSSAQAGASSVQSGASSAQEGASSVQSGASSAQAVAPRSSVGLLLSSLGLPLLGLGLPQPKHGLPMSSLGRFCPGKGLLCPVWGSFFSSHSLVLQPHTIGQIQSHSVLYPISLPQYINMLFSI